VRKCILTLVAAAAVIAVPLPAVAGPSSDAEIADGAVLTIEDVPAGFEEEPITDEAPPSGRACKDIRRGRKLLDSAPSAEAEFRTPGDETGGALINNKVTVFKSARGAKRAYAAYAAPQSAECFRLTYEEIFLEQLDDPDASVDISVDEYDPDLGDAAVGYEIEIQASAQGESNTFYIDIEVARVGRAIEGFAFFNSGNPPPSDDVVAMTEAGVGRLESSL